MLARFERELPNVAADLAAKVAAFYSGDSNVGNQFWSGAITALSKAVEDTEGIMRTDSLDGKAEQRKQAIRLL